MDPGEVREQILVTKGVTGHPIQPPLQLHNTMYSIVKLPLACEELSVVILTEARLPIPLIDS